MSLQDLELAFQASPELAKLYDFRNKLQAIFDSNYSFKEAQEKVEAWLVAAQQIGNTYLNKFIDLFQGHRIDIMNYFKERVSNGVVEGTNNLLRTIKRITFNMTNFDHFRARVLIWKI